MKDLIVRKAEEADVTAIASLDRLCFSAPWSQAAFREEIVENKLALYIVAEVDSVVVGYAGIWGILDEGHITNVAVHPDFRRKNIGEVLVDFLIARCAEEGIFTQTLEVRPSNEAALRLYDKFGFRIAGRRKGYYEDNGEDALIMWRGTDSSEHNE